MKEAKDQSALSTQNPVPLSKGRHRARCPLPRLRYSPPSSSLSGAAASERGAALITMMLVGVLAAGLLSMSWLESVDRDRRLHRHNEYSLAVAKDALIGYSAAYPDTRSSKTKNKKGPGRLPCPDKESDGSADATGCQSMDGFPWRQLGLVPQSGSNEDRIGYLWYALDEEFRADSTIRKVNMNTEPVLKIDDKDDVVAVIIAPGAPLDFQDRSRKGFAPEDYLEAENATTGDNEFTYGRVVAPDPRLFNDRPAVLTRDELMDVVALRVFAAVRAYLYRYRNADWNEKKLLPWLLPTLNEDRTVLATPGTSEGWLPILVNDGSEFETRFTLTGSLEGGKIEESVDPAALGLPKEGLSVEKGRCIWESLGKVTCKGSASTRYPDGRVRIYEIDIYLEGKAKVIPPTVDDIRRRNVKGEKWLKKPKKLKGSKKPKESTIKITEYRGKPLTQENLTRKGTVKFSENAPISKDGRGALSVSDIAFPPSATKEDPDDQRLPYWLPDNDWHRLLRVEIASPFSVGGSGSCLEGGCFSVTRHFVDGRRSRRDDIAVVLLLPGRVIPPSMRDEGNFISHQWFEGKNAIGDGQYETRLRTPFFNDYLDALAPSFFERSDESS